MEEVAEKVLRHSEALGGLSRFSFQLDVAGLTHEQLMNAIDLLGNKVSPIVNKSYLRYLETKTTAIRVGITRKPNSELDSHPLFP